MLKIQNLQKIGDGKTVIEINSFHVASGQIVGLWAQPGSGVETLIDLLTGKVRPSAGTLLVGEIIPYLERAALGELLGVMFHEDAVYKNLGARANLRFQAQLHGLSKGHADFVLNQIGLADQAHKSAGKLSPGLQRRLSFGRAIIHKPKFLLLIEPYIRCDSTTISFLDSKVQELADEGTAILIISTDLSRLMPISDQLFELQNGKVKQLQSQPTNEEPLHQLFKIPVKTEDTVLLINPAEVLYADTGEGRTFLITTDNRLPTQYTLTELEERLKSSGFFRAHRSFLVNLQHVREVIPFTRNSFSLRLDDAAGTQIPLSKSAAAELKDLLRY